MIHALRPVYEPILQIPANLPHRNNHLSYRQQHVSALHWLRGRWHHVLSSYWLMVRTSRRQHSCPPSSPIQPSRRHWSNSCHSLNGHPPKLMRTSTNLFHHKRHRPNPPPRRPNLGCNWQISPIWPTSMAPLRHRGPHAGLCPTPL